VKPAGTLAAIVAGLVLLPVLAFAVAKSQPHHGTPPPHAAPQQRPADTAPSQSI
jgi:hypothetical protein